MILTFLSQAGLVGGRGGAVCTDDLAARAVGGPDRTHRPQLRLAAVAALTSPSPSTGGERRNSSSASQLLTAPAPPSTNHAWPRTRAHRSSPSPPSASDTAVVTGRPPPPSLPLAWSLPRPSKRCAGWISSSCSTYDVPSQSASRHARGGAQSAPVGLAAAAVALRNTLARERACRHDGKHTRFCGPDGKPAGKRPSSLPALPTPTKLTAANRRSASR
jgi:hypothetical protein